MLLPLPPPRWAPHTHTCTTTPHIPTHLSTPGWNQVLWQVVRSVTTVAKLVGGCRPLRMRCLMMRSGTDCDEVEATRRRGRGGGGWREGHGQKEKGAAGRGPVRLEIAEKKCQNNAFISVPLTRPPHPPHTTPTHTCISGCTDTTRSGWYRSSASLRRRPEIAAVTAEKDSCTMRGCRAGQW